MFYHVSGEAVVWAIVGGAGTLFGPIVGTSLFIVVREIVSTHWEHHALIVGVVAILVVIFAPKGLVGLWNEWLARWTEHAPKRRRSRRKSADRAMTEPVLRTENLTKRFGGLTAVDNLSFESRRRPPACHHRPERRRQDHVLQSRFGPARRPTAAASSFRAATSLGSSRTRSAGSASSARCRSRACFRSSVSRKTSGSPAGRPALSESVPRGLARSGIRAKGRAHSRADRARRARATSGRHAVLRRRRAARDRHGADF